MKTTQFPFKITHNIAKNDPFEVSYSDNSKVKDLTRFVGPENDEIKGCNDFVVLTHFEDGSSYLVSCTNDYVVMWSTKETKLVDGKYVI